MSLRRDPVRLVFSRAPWAGSLYLFTYLFIGMVLFMVVLAATTTAAVLSITLAGLPLLVAAAAVVRGCASVERSRLRLVSSADVRGGYRKAARPGLLAGLRARWTDPATWRDLTLLAGLFAPLVVLDWAVLACWLVLLAGITLPAWYHYPRQTFTIGVSGGQQGSVHGVQLGYFPHGPHGPGSWGIYVDTMPKAVAVAAVCLVLFLAFNYALVATARLHAAIACALLRAPQDPLREAREVLSRPGPLAALRDPAAGDPALGGLALSHTVLSRAAFSHTALSRTALGNAVLDETVLDDTVLNETMPTEAVPDEAVPDKAAPNKTWGLPGNHPRP